MSVKDYCQYLRAELESRPGLIAATSNSNNSCEVLARTKSLYWTKFPTSRRHKAQAFSGGGGARHQPYKMFGTLPEGHVFEWVAQSFDIKPPKNLFYSHHEQSVNSWKQMQQNRSASPFIRVPIIRTTKGQGAQPNAMRGGISSLKLSLIAMEECNKKTKIGIPYKHVPVFVANKSNEKHMIAQSAWDNISITTNIMAGIAISKFKRALGKDFTRINQSEELCLHRLHAIYSILCSLHNIKTKDLKSKTPVQSSLLDYMSHNYRKESNISSKLSQFCKQHDGSTVDRRLANIFNDSSKIPPWQMQIVFIDEKAAEIEGNDIQLKLESCYERHRQLKTDFSWKMKEEIEERERTCARLLEVKLQQLQFGPNPIRQFKLMREKAHYICSQEKDNKPSWFTYLRKEIDTVFYNKEARRKGYEVLEQINTFTFEDTSAIPYVFEKFCLLAMSTPAHELCIAPVIEAIKFVLEKILSTSSKLCKQWLELRQLPWQQFFY